MHFLLLLTHAFPRFNVFHSLKLFMLIYKACFHVLFKTALLRYNSQTLQFIHLRCTAQWYLVYSDSCKHYYSLLLEHLLSKKKPCIHQQSLTIPLSPHFRQPLTFCFYRFACCGYLIFIESYSAGHVQLAFTFKFLSFCNMLVLHSFYV